MTDTPPNLVGRLEDLANEYGRINSWPKPLIQEAAAEILKLQERVGELGAEELRLRERLAAWELQAQVEARLRDKAETALTAAKQENERLKTALDKIIHSSPFSQRPQIIDFARAALATEGRGGS